MHQIPSLRPDFDAHPVCCNRACVLGRHPPYEHTWTYSTYFKPAMYRYVEG